MYRDARFRNFIEGGMMHSPGGYSREPMAQMMGDGRMGGSSPVTTMAALAAQLQHQQEMPVQVHACAPATFTCVQSVCCAARDRS
jgi:hypothetical protein